jgi:hypothetical protein
MIPPDHDSLLRDVLSEGPAASGLQEESLGHLLAAARRRRVKVRVIRAGSALALAAVVLFALSFSLTSDRHGSRGVAASGTAAPSVSPRSTTAETTSPVRRISDEELFALFPGRQMAIIGPPGDQRLIFLDK